MPHPIAPPWDPDEWAKLDEWLFGVDLFNYAYWWESHEQLEALWLAAGRTTEHARFVQGLIKIAAGCLNLWLGKTEGAREQCHSGISAMLAAAQPRSGVYMGIEVTPFDQSVSRWTSAGEPTEAAPLITLVVPR